MNWNYLLVGTGFLAGAFLLYKMRKWDYYKGDHAGVINKMKSVQHWLVIGMCLVVGIVFVCKSFIIE